MQSLERIIVQNLDLGKVGVIVPTVSWEKERGPWSVIYKGSIFGRVILGNENFRPIGTERPIADPNGCGYGQGEKACKFCIFDDESQRLECVRFTDKHWFFAFRPSDAKREPTELFPKCQFSQ